MEMFLSAYEGLVRSTKEESVNGIMAIINEHQGLGLEHTALYPGKLRGVDVVFNQNETRGEFDITTPDAWKGKFLCSNQKCDVVYYRLKVYV